MKVLVIACHPDDEVVGCGGVIQRHIAEGDNVSVLIVTKAPEPEWDVKYRVEKINEQIKVDKFLEIDHRYYLHLDALSLNILSRGRLNFKIQEAIEEIEPNIIYTHFNHELNEEHNIISMATLVGTRIPNKSTIYMYETPSGRFSLTPFKPNYYVELSTTQLHKKVEAFKMYGSEVKDMPHPRSLLGIQDLAHYRGDEVGIYCAEAFIQVRRLWL